MNTLFSSRNATTGDVVDTFLNFFKSHEHLHVGSAPLVPKDDPTLLFVNSGMAPMKKYFLGEETPPQPNLCNIQSCIRTNDIEEVGDRHHLTYFEMLGSWSIGSYWKDTAIALAFELLTKGFGFPAEKLYATIYAGESERKIPPDDESGKRWVEVGLPPANIVPLGDDNFWGPAGEFGPCGPCTEVYFDTGDAFGPKYTPGGHFDDKGRYIEIWNAGVFMEYDLQRSGLTPLEIRSVDTGSGLERMVMTLNRNESVYDVDSMKPVLASAEGLLSGGGHPGRDGRLICDHTRAAVHILAEGVLPSNTGRGYIARRLLRRSLAILAQTNTGQLDLRPVLDTVYAQLRPWNRVKADSYAAVSDAIRTEAQLFAHTLDRGLKTLKAAIPSDAPLAFSGKEAFALFSTFGLPVDTIRDYVEQRGGTFDQAGFAQAFAEHQQVSRTGAKLSENPELVAAIPVSVFDGHSQTRGEGKVLAILKEGQLSESLESDERGGIILDRTVFYPEGGGQIGDTGRIEGPNGQCRVETTQKFPTGQILHLAAVESGSISVGDVLNLQVDENIRAKRRAHHSATHLLNSALREVLGPHVEQRGSLVSEDRLRFDFSHDAAVSAEELQRVEQLVNANIRRNLAAEVRILPYAAAVSEGALGVFTEKYGDEVRVVSFGDVSKELCFGTHVGATGEIGLCLIGAEAASSRGVRRITAYAGEPAYELVRDTRKKQSEIAARLGTSTDKLMETLELRLGKAMPAKATKGLDPTALKADVKSLASGARFLLVDTRDELLDLAKTVPDLAEALSAIVCCIVRTSTAARVAVAIPQANLGLASASQILGDLLPMIGGKGGGKDKFAMGGGTQIAGTDKLAADAMTVVDRSVANKKIKSG